MKTILKLAMLGALLLSGCATARFYPVQGPLAAQTPAPVLVGKIKGAFNSGSVSVTLSDGETCQGRWTTVVRPSKSTDSPAAGAGDLATEWDTVYGSGFYVSHVLGARLHAKAILSGNKGANLSLEMFKPDDFNKAESAAAIRGVAKDDKGNVYKVTFS
jgi:hypothetical protein